MAELCLVLACLLTVCAAQFQESELCGMTPETLMDDFLRNCNDLVRNGNCMNIWMTFRSAFAGVEPESVTPSDYKPYFMAVPIQAGANMSLFWTRTASLVDVLSMMNSMGVNVVSSFNAKSSEIINRINAPSGSLSWCGNASGIDFVNRCLCNVTGRFWHQFSAAFAEAASGNAFYLADGEDRDGAFRSNSFFSTVEIPSMRSGVVKRVVALIVHRKGMGEDCATGRSVKVLRQRIAERQFAFDCYDILAQASSPNTNATANCVRTVINKVQMGKEDSKRIIPCSGSSPLRESLVGLLISFCISYILVSLQV